SDGRFCNGAEVCSATIGCTAGPPTTCDDMNVCTSDACDERSRMCVFLPRDQDADGVIAQACGGGDCDDTNAMVHPGAMEICDDRRDNDCNGLSDCVDPVCRLVPACLA